jgi:hypothetical protein
MTPGGGWRVLGSGLANGTLHAHVREVMMDADKSKKDARKRHHVKECLKISTRSWHVEQFVKSKTLNFIKVRERTYQ